MDENNEGPDQEPMQAIGEVGDEEEEEEDDDEEEDGGADFDSLSTPDSELGAAPLPNLIRRRPASSRFEGRPFSFLRGQLQQRDSQDDQDDDETMPDDAEKFDTDLPAEHSYLGAMVRVSGVEYLEAGKVYRMLIFMHHSMVFPGETLPMIIPEYMFDSTLFPEEGLLFGIVFPYLWRYTTPDLFGVTCQIYERGNDEVGNIVLKSRAHQRFVITRKNNPNFADLLRYNQRKVYAYVQILPEILLPDPLNSIDLGSMNRFRGIPSMSAKLRRMQASTTAWPHFIYDHYNITTVVERAKKCLNSYKIESMPTDYTMLSFWLGRNLLFHTSDRVKIFLTDSVNMRMQIIEKHLDKEKFFCCRRCKSKIANCSSLFAMSKHGVQSNYCNPSGFIHETNTVYNIEKSTVYPSGAPSTEFSWFPGYSWQIILCRLCDVHLGWKFISTKPNLIPKKFYGLSGTNISVDIPSPREGEGSSETAVSEMLLLYENMENPTNQ